MSSAGDGEGGHPVERPRVDSSNAAKQRRFTIEFNWDAGISGLFLLNERFSFWGDDFLQ